MNNYYFPLPTLFNSPPTAKRKKIEFTRTKFLGIFQASKMAPPIPESLAKSLEASKAEYVRLGNSGLRVSVPIFWDHEFG